MGLFPRACFGFDCYLIQVIKRLIELIFYRFLSTLIQLKKCIKKAPPLRSEEVGLAHDAHELVLGDLAVTVTVSLLDHLLDLVIGHVLTELLGHTLEVTEGNLACLVVVKQTEGF